MVLSTALLSGFACSSKSSKPTPLTDDALANAAYPSQLAPGGLAQLKDSHFAMPNPGNQGTTNAALLDVRGRGEIDMDKTEDAAVVLAENGGGSGSFISLIVVLNNAGKPEVGASIALGDRQVVHSVDIANHQILLKMRIHAQPDPSCCPSVETTRTYAIKDGKLALVAKTDSVPD